LCAIAVSEGLECPSVTKIYIYKPPARARGGWIYVSDEVYVEPVSESIAIGEGAVNVLVYRLAAGYMALAIYRSSGVIDSERAVELAREHYFTLLVGR